MNHGLIQQAVTAWQAAMATEPVAKVDEQTRLAALSMAI